MGNRIEAIRLNHMNVVLEDFDASVACFKALYDAEFMADLTSAPDFHACLMAMGGGIFELFVPSAYLFNARYGPFHLGVEYQADMDVVRSVLAANGIQIIRDIGAAVHTHPEDTLGVSFEFYGGCFHDREWPLLGRPIRSAAWWREEHPLGLTSLAGYSVAVTDLEAATALLMKLFVTHILYEEDRRAINARAVGLQLGDSVLELLGPAGEGMLFDYVRRAGQGIRSTIFSVRNLDQARRYFRERNVEVSEGSAGDTIIVEGAANRNVMFEFRPERG